MKKILLLALVILSVVLGYTLSSSRPFKGDTKESALTAAKKPILQSRTSLLRVALVADSHNENELLAKALRQAQGMGINFVIGLGDYTNLGTVGELEAARAKFGESKLEYFLTAGDRDGWESRNREEVDNFQEIFGEATRVFDREGIRFVILDNSDIYKGIESEDWVMLEGLTLPETPQGETLSGLTFVFAHKTPFHPQSKHVMGENSQEVASQANQLIKLIEEKKVDGFFSGDLHFFAKYQSPQQSVKITTIGAVAAERNFQGPRFAILTVYDDYSWEVEDVEIR